MRNRSVFHKSVVAYLGQGFLKRQSLSNFNEIASPTMVEQGQFPRTLWILPLLLMTSLLFLFPQWTVDDAFISYRYGRNFLATGDWVWNVGESRVEGFTGYFLPMLAALFIKMGVGLESAFRWMGVLATLLSLVMLGEIVRALKINAWIGFVMLMVFCLQPWVYVHAGSGLETAVFMASVCLHLRVLAGIRSGSPTWWQGMAWVLTAMLAAWIRPEGLLLAMASLLAGVWISKGSRKAWLVSGAVFLLIAGVAQAWRIEYFGSLWPQSVLAKEYAGWFNPDSIKEMIRFFSLHLAIPGALVLALGWVEVDGSGTSNQPFMQTRRKILLVLAGAYSVPSILVYGHSHLFMNYAGRFFVPMMVLGLVGLACVADWGWVRFHETRTTKPLRWKWAKVLAVILLLVQSGILVAKWRSEWSWVRRYSAIMEHEYKPVAEAIRTRMREGDRIICYMDAGVIPYITAAQTTDFGRLNEPRLSRLEAGSPEAVDYFFEQEARFVVFTSFFEDRYVYLEEAHAIQADPRFANFRLLAVFSAPGVTDYFQFLFERVELSPVSVTEDPAT